MLNNAQLIHTVNKHYCTCQTDEGTYPMFDNVHNLIQNLNLKLTHIHVGGDTSPGLIYYAWPLQD